MSKFICTKDFHVPLIDDDGFRLEGDFAVSEGTEWYKSDENFIDGEVHLKNDNSWIEISEYTLKEHFMEVRNEPE